MEEFCTLFFTSPGISIKNLLHLMHFSN